MSAPSDINERAAVELSPVSDHMAGRFIESVIQGYKRARIQALVQFFAPLFGSYAVKFPAGTSALDIDSVYKLLTGQTPPSLELTRRACALLFASRDNVRRAFVALPAAYRLVFGQLFSDVFVSGDMIRRTIESNLDKYRQPVRDGASREAFVSADVVSTMLQRVSGFSRSECYTMEFGMLRYIGEILGAGLFSRRRPRTVAALPDGPFTIHACADDFIAGIPALTDSLAADRIQAAQANGALKASDLKVLAAINRLPEFFPDSPLRQLQDLRIRDTVTLVNAWFRRRNSVPADNVEAARLCTDFMKVDNFMLACLSLPYINNLRKSYFERTDYRLVFRRLIRALQDFAADADGHPLWTDASDLATYVFSDLPPSTRLMATPQEYGSIRPMYDTNTGKEISDTTVVRALSLPAIKGLMLVLGSAGLADIAVGPSDRESGDPFGALRYIRLSDFGRYCAGLAESYTPAHKTVKNTAVVELDPDRLIITALTKEARSVVKSRFGEPVGAGRFLVTEKSFFRQVYVPSELHAKVEMLRSLAALDSVPPLWDDFFNSFDRHFTAIQGKPLDMWHLFEIDPTCPGLADLLTTDPVIRPLIRLVEGNAFLVERTDLHRLFAALHEHGYPELYPADYL